MDEKPKRRRAKKDETASPFGAVCLTFALAAPPNLTERLQGMLQELADDKPYKVMSECKMHRTVSQIAEFESPWEAALCAEMAVGQYDPRFHRVFIVGPSSIEP